MRAGDGFFGAGGQVLLVIVDGFNGEGVSSFDFAEDIGGEFFESCWGKGS